MSALVGSYAAKGEAYLRATLSNWFLIELCITISIGFTCFINTCIETSRFSGFNRGPGTLGGLKFGYACAFFGCFCMLASVSPRPLQTPSVFLFFLLLLLFLS